MSKEIHDQLKAEGCMFLHALLTHMGGKFTLITATCENEEDAASVRRWAEKNDCKHDVHVATSEEAASWKRQAAQLAMRTP